MIQFKIIFLIILLPTFVFAQEGMTLDEYRYLTKGFAYQKEMGLDASKAGYQIIEKKSIDDVQLVILKKETISTPQGLLFIISAEGKKDTYICLPNNFAKARVKELFELDQEKIRDASIMSKFHQAVQHTLFDSYLDIEKNAQIVVAKDSFGKKQHSDHPTTTENDLTSKGIHPENYEVNLSVKEPEQNLEKSVNNNTNIKIGGTLDQRALVSEPVVLGAHYNKGMVVIKICVNENGKVIQAKYTQKGSTTFNKQLKKLAVNSAKKTIFAKSDRPKSCGTITYHFK